MPPRTPSLGHRWLWLQTEPLCSNAPPDLASGARRETPSPSSPGCQKPPRDGKQDQPREQAEEEDVNPEQVFSDVTELLDQGAPEAGPPGPVSYWGLRRVSTGGFKPTAPCPMQGAAPTGRAFFT